MRRVWAQAASQFALTAAAFVEWLGGRRVVVGSVLASACGRRFPDRRMDLPDCRADIGNGAGRAASTLHSPALAAKEPC